MSGMRWLPTESDCANGMDDDDDGLVDCADDDCDADSACQANSNNSNSNNINSNNNNSNGSGSEYCTNLVDDDGDGLVDCADPDCAVAPSCLSEDCGNGTDDDGDGLADCDDPDCSGSPGCVPEECTNGVDDDGNGLTDCEDPQCAAAPNCALETCDNGVDDDFDGLADCEDDDCLNSSECGVCHPMSNAGCGPGTTCYVISNNDYFGECRPGDGSGDGQWHWCDEPSDCQLGYYCSFGYSACVRVCHPGGNDCASIPGTTCRPFTDFGGSSPWGMCVY